MTLLEAEKEILHILEIYDTADNKKELDNRLYHLRSQLGYANTKKINPKKKKKKRIVNRKKYLKYREIASKNGISTHTFYYRIQSGWGYERAANEPVRGKRK